MKYYIAIDAGTSVIKTVILNTNFKHINSYSVKNPVITDKFGKSEIEMEKFWLLTAKCIKILIKKSKIQTQSIIGLGITGNMVGFGLLIIKINLWEMQFCGMTQEVKKFSQIKKCLIKFIKLQALLYNMAVLYLF